MILTAKVFAAYAVWVALVLAAVVYMAGRG